jgi:hypothetical protein
MASKVKGPVSPGGPQVTTPTGATVGAPLKPKSRHPARASSADSLSKAAQGFSAIKSSPLVSGAYKIFSDGVVFPRIFSISKTLAAIPSTFVFSRR